MADRPPARTPKLRSARRYTGDAGRFQEGVCRARPLLEVLYFALDAAKQRAFPRFANDLQDQRSNRPTVISRSSPCASAI